MLQSFKVFWFYLLQSAYKNLIKQIIQITCLLQHITCYMPSTKQCVYTAAGVEKTHEKLRKHYIYIFNLQITKYIVVRETMNKQIKDSYFSLFKCIKKKCG